MAQETAAQENTGPRFEIHKIYLKNASLEAPNSPQVFNEQWTPEVTVQLANLSTPLNSEEGLLDVVLRVTVTSKFGDKVIYLVEVEYAGIFTITGFEADQLGHMQGAFCPNMLFPYARETLDSLLMKGGFSPVTLAPINFDALYAQRLEQMRAEGSA